MIRLVFASALILSLGFGVISALVLLVAAGVSWEGRPLHRTRA